MKYQHNAGGNPPVTLHSLDSARQALGGLGRTTLFALLKEGEIRSINIGARRMIPQTEIDAYVARKLEEEWGDA